ncbi:MAG: metallophosphoesterase [Methylococcaceae bacterium]|nr:metallophosphoesterase [Methylococcaceae bacterium]MCI0667011.1 metallophosphoesterase [Methylococcaceae bacterium]MCI0734083.1 metallophosphoesterase [Methylococcaceae bacterium]
MLINFFSDIHLEFGSLPIPDTQADVIIAAGDIGIYKQGMDWLKTAEKPVVYVAGNHEFYDQEYRSTLDALRSSSANSNVKFLECDSFQLDGVRFLGCTLWTQLGGQDNERLDELKNTVNDFRKINYENALMDLETYAGLHRKSRTWLIGELSKPFQGNTIVVTHHAPTFWSWDDTPKSPTRFAYCNDLKEIMHNYEITAWFHGHTHSVSDYRCAGTRILCNPRGYHGRQTVAGFALDKVVKV